MAYPVTTLMSPKNDYILLYEVINGGQLVISRCDLQDPKKGHVRYNPSQQLPNGLAKMPSRISAVYLNGLPSVYGSVGISKEEAGNVVKAVTGVGQISPVLQTIASKKKVDEYTLTAENLSVAAVSDEDSRLWLYYFQRPGEKKPLVLTCASITGSDAAEYEAFDGTQGIDSSRIAVVGLRDSNMDRVIFFQEKKKEKNTQIKYFLSGAGSAEGTIKGSDNAKDGTPLAAACTGKDADRVVYVYWLNKSNQLYRSVCKGADLNKWSDPQEIKKANEKNHSPIESTELSVTAGPTGNYVFFIADGQPEDTTYYNYVVDSLTQA